MTEYIISGRGQGKTTKALQHLLDNPEFVMVTATERMAVDARQRATAMGIENTKERIVSGFTMWSAKRSQASYQSFIVDNAELVLSGFLNGSVETMTMTEEVDPEFDSLGYPKSSAGWMDVQFRDRDALIHILWRSAMPGWSAIDENHPDWSSFIQDAEKIIEGDWR